ncbi:MAG TPA: hypothetical protein PKK69_10705, partial [Ferruginibacter sp.]|nr:hypothetical protein [Ferruginibacter sp.]
IAPASYSSVTITPTANVTVSGNIAGALVKLNGADNVTINGLLAGTRQLTFNNTNASSAAVVMWLACASAADGATNNAIRNCNINGATLTTTLAGIASSGITLGSVAETANANNTYENNSITTAQYGIAVVGPSVMETGTIIRGNLIGSTTPANKIYFRGLFISNQQNISVTQNTIRGVAFASGSGLNQGSGIYVVGAISGGSIDRNSISDVTVVSFWGCNGIQLNSSTANTGLVIANNFIYDIAAGGWTSFDSVDDNGTGIAVNSGGGYNIWYNSINLTTNQSSGITAAIWFSTDVSLATLNIRNNIFANSQTTGTRYSIYSNSANTIFSSINYNDYYTTGAAIGFMLTTSYATLANWQSATGQDANSVNIIPNFTSTTDLHLLG